MSRLVGIMIAMAAISIAILIPCKARGFKIVLEISSCRDIKK